MRIVVIGSHGLIGHNVVVELCHRGHEVVAIDKSFFGSWPEGWKRTAALQRHEEVAAAASEALEFNPVADFEKLGTVFQDGVDCLVNIGGESLASEFRDPASYALAEMAPLNQLLVGKTIQHSARYIYISSSMVYGNFSEDPIREHARLDPLDPYGALKLGCEAFVRAAGFQHPGFDYAVLRPSAVYGAHDVNERVLVRWAHLAAKNTPIVIDNPSSRLDFTHVEDLARMIAVVADFDGLVRDTYNVSNGNAVELGDAFKALQSLVPGAVASRGEEGDQDVKRPIRGTLSPQKYQRKFGVHHARGLRDGLADVLEKSVRFGFFH